MSFVIVEDFRGGVDRRRPPIAGTPGTLTECIDGHINRGGDVERRKSFVSTHSLPAGTFGMQSATRTLHVFGSVAEPGGMPAEVTYQRLQHPDGLAMTGVVFSEVFDGKVHVIAEYSDASRFHFYDGDLVLDWNAGLVRAGMTDNDGIATHLAGVIDAHDDFGAASTTNVVTITGAENVPFTISGEASNGEGNATDDQAITVNTTQTSVVVVEEVLSEGSFKILGGSSDAGVNKISDVKVNGVTVVSEAEDWATSNALTAANIAANINAHTSTPNYTADASGDTVTVKASAGTGDAPNGFTLSVTTAGDVIIANGSFEIIGGKSPDNFVNVKVNGIDILGATVNWATSNTATAQGMADQINTNTSTPDYVAFAVGAVVLISPLTADGENPSDLIVVVGVSTPNTAGNFKNVDTAVSDLADGITAATGQPQISIATISGTFEAGDEFTIVLEDIPFGFARSPDGPASASLTFKSKLYVISGSLLHFSGINAPDKWNRGDPNVLGANFINMANQDAGSEELTGLGVYEGSLAVFSRGAIQVWFIDVDETANQLLQTLKNTGTRSPGSVLSFGNNDVFYLSDSGIRSLRSRNSSGTAFVNDVGTAIDPLVLSTIAALTDTQIQAAASILEPIDGRFWLSIGDTIFVFSFFPGSKISAWSTYKPGFEVSQFSIIDNRVYARSGDTIYLYGGPNNDVYPAAGEAPLIIQIPFLAAGKDADDKNNRAFDAAVTNTWTVEILYDPRNTNIRSLPFTISETTYPDESTPFEVVATHVAVRMICDEAGPATLTNLAIAFENGRSA